MIVLSNMLLSLLRVSSTVFAWMEFDDPSVVYLFNLEAASSDPVRH